MNFGICVRQPSPALRCLHARSLSSKAKTAAKNAKSQTPAAPSTPYQRISVDSHMSLPPAKMRALVALYHQADTWITPENLLQRIDEAFLPPPVTTAIESTASNSTRTVTYDDIQKARKLIMNAPKMAKWDSAAGAPLQARQESGQDSWSNNRASRERKVIEALYGVVTSPNSSKLMPGLEVVQEFEHVLKETQEMENGKQ